MEYYMLSSPHVSCPSTHFKTINNARKAAYKLIGSPNMGYTVSITKYVRTKEDGFPDAMRGEGKVTALHRDHPSKIVWVDRTGIVYALRKDGILGRRY